MKTQTCIKCDAKYVDEHSELECMTAQLDAAKLQIKKLNNSVDAWKDSWYHQREIIGRLAWQNNLDIHNSWKNKETSHEDCKKDSEEDTCKEDGEEAPTSP